MSKILIAIPCMETLPLPFVESLLRLRKPSGSQISFLSCSLVYTAREMLAQLAFSGEFTHILFLDSDMTFQSDLIERMLELDKDVVTGLAFKRKPPYTPCIYRPFAAGEFPEPWLDYPKDTLFEIGACGLAAAMIKVEVLQKLREHGSIFAPIGTLGEDFAFCLRAKREGYSIWADTRLKIGHIGQRIITEEDYACGKKEGSSVNAC